MHIHCLQTTSDAQLARDVDSIIVQCWSKVCSAGPALPHRWFVFWYLLAGDMGARGDTGKENQDKGNKNNIYTIKIILLYIIV